MYQYSFEKLEVWQLSIKLVTQIYSLTKDFPSDEKFGLYSQLRRASVSISNNIAEGNSRVSNKSQANFLQIAYASLIEVLNMLIISVELEYITTDQLAEIRLKIEEISNKINALYKHKLKKEK